VDGVRLRNVVLVAALALASWLGAEFVLDMVRSEEARPVPPIVLDVRDDRPERKGKGSDRDTGGRASPSSSSGQPGSGAEPAPPPPPPPAGDDDDDDDGGGDTDDGGDSDD
jgi:hypothetical protein